MEGQQKTNEKENDSSVVSYQIESDSEWLEGNFVRYTRLGSLALEKTKNRPVGSTEFNSNISKSISSSTESRLDNNIYYAGKLSNGEYVFRYDGTSNSVTHTIVVDEYGNKIWSDVGEPHISSLYILDNNIVIDGDFENNRIYDSEGNIVYNTTSDRPFIVRNNMVYELPISDNFETKFSLNARNVDGSKEWSISADSSSDVGRTVVIKENMNTVAVFDAVTGDKVDEINVNISDVTVEPDYDSKDLYITNDTWLSKMSLSGGDYSEEWNVSIDKEWDENANLISTSQGLFTYYNTQYFYERNENLTTDRSYLASYNKGDGSLEYSIDNISLFRNNHRVLNHDKLYKLHNNSYLEVYDSSSGDKDKVINYGHADCIEKRGYHAQNLYFLHLRSGSCDGSYSGTSMTSFNTEGPPDTTKTEHYGPDSKYI
jgi:hypothetical protein